MNADRLLALFERIADAPDAIARLRRFILDLAVRGKLVPQDENEEPAKVLDRIDNKLTRSRRKRPTDQTDRGLERVRIEGPFALPPGWTWTTLGWICSKTGSGSTPRGGKQVYRDSGVPFLRSQNVYNDGVRLDDVAYIDDKTHRAMEGTRVIPGDLLLNITGGSIGRCCIVPSSLTEANVSQHVAIIRLAVGDLGFFVHTVILSPYFQSFVVGEQTGAGRGGLPKNRMDRIPVALPPLTEQRRIVAKVDELMALCDRLEAARAERETTREQLAVVSFARLNTPDPDQAKFASDARFAHNILPALTARQDQIKNLRQTILNLAVRGKLVPQDPSDESASELLNRIAKEKARLVQAGVIRKGKPPPPIRENSCPFVLPTRWAWTRLGQLSKAVTSGSRDWAKHYAEEGAIFVRMGNLSRGSYNLRLNSIQRVQPPRDAEGARTRLEAGDLLISITGEVGLLGLIPPNFGEAYINQHTCVVRLMEALQGRFIPEILRSPFAQGQFNAPQRGIKNSFRLTDVTEFLVPLPPLAEQRRIVAKIEELMTLCDRLETCLTASNVTRSRLLDALLAEALVPLAKDLQVTQ